MADIYDDSAIADYAALSRLDGRRVIVVGAGQGMGRQTAHALTAYGARVFCVDVDQTRADRVAGETGGHAWSGDMTQRADVARMVDAAAGRLGGIDGFVDIIGMAQWQSIAEMEDTTWDSQFAICLRHAYLVSQLTAPHMIAAGGGTMVFIASVSGLTAAPNHAAYGAAKAGLMAWVRSLAVEFGPKQIRANAIAPGTVGTPRILAMMGANGNQGPAAEAAPLKRIAKTSEIATTALFLTSPLSSFITGQTIVVDGGAIVKFPFQI